MKNTETNLVFTYGILRGSEHFDKVLLENYKLYGALFSTSYSAPQAGGFAVFLERNEILRLFENLTEREENFIVPVFCPNAGQTGRYSNSPCCSDDVYEYGAQNLAWIDSFELPARDYDRPVVVGTLGIMDDARLERCDQIEGHPDFYQRTLVGINDITVYTMTAERLIQQWGLPRA